MKYIILFLFTACSCILYSQEDSLHVKIGHNVFEPDIVNPSTRVETFIEVTDSIDFFIDKVQKEFGEIEEEDGNFVWNNVNIDSIGANLRIQMIHGYWSIKGSTATLKIIPTSKAAKLKSDERRILRIRVFLKNGKDALTSKKNEIIIVQLLDNLLNQVNEKDSEE